MCPAEVDESVEDEEDSEKDSSEDELLDKLQKFPANTFRDVEWLELMSASRSGEAFREKSRKKVQLYWLQQRKARLYEAEMRYRTAKAQEEAILPLRDDSDPLEFKDLAQERKEALQEFKTVQESLAVDAEPTKEIEDATKSAAKWYTAWVHELNQLSVAMFVQHVTVLSVEDGQENLRSFMESLTLELSWSRVAEKLKKMPGVPDLLGAYHDLSEWDSLMNEGRNFRMFFHEVMAVNEEEPQKLNLASCVKEMSTKKFHKSFADKRSWRLLLDLRRIVVESFRIRNAVCARSNIAISPAVKILHPQIRDGEVAFMLKSLVDAGQDSHCFNTVIGRAVLSDALDRTRLGRMIDGLVDVLYIFVLVLMAVAVECDHTPPQYVLVTFTLLSVFVGISLFLKLGGGVMLFSSTKGGFIAGVLKHLNLWTILLTATEVFSTYVGIRFVAYALEGSNEDGAWTLFKTHPGFLSVMVLIRWCQIGIGLLQVEKIGRNVVPVVFAITRPASINFLLFLLIIVLGSFHAYYVFPIRENSGSLNKIFNTFLKIFRFEILGDFDLTELEGLGDEINGTISKHHIAAEMETQPWSKIYHRVLRFEFMAMSLFVTVVVMNVYIGLLGELYSEAVKKKNQLYHHFLATSAYRHLGRRLGYKYFVGCCEDKTRNQAPAGVMWMAFNKAKLVDEEDCPSVHPGT